MKRALVALIHAVQQGDLMGFDQALGQIGGDLSYPFIDIPIQNFPIEVVAVKNLMKVLHFVAEEICSLMADKPNLMTRGEEQRFPLAEIIYFLQPHVRACFPSLSYSSALVIRTLIAFLDIHVEENPHSTLTKFIDWLKEQSRLPDEKFTQAAGLEKLKGQENIICQAYIFEMLAVLKMKHFCEKNS